MLSQLPYLTIIPTLIVLALYFNPQFFKQDVYLLGIFLGVSTIYFLNKAPIKRPSDFFIYFFSLFILGPFLFFSARDITLLFYGYVLLTFPLCLLKHSSHFSFTIHNAYNLNTKIFIYSMLFISFLAIFLCYFILNHPFSLEITSSYERRLFFRHEFPQRSILAYAISNTSNFVIPFLTFIFYLRKPFFLFFPFLLAVLIFAIVGTKATFAYITIAVLVAHLSRQNKLERFPLYFFVLLVVLFSLGLIEQFISYSHYSFILDRVFIRSFISVTETMIRYLTFVNTQNDFSIISGFYFNSSISHFIGSTYIGTEANDNTNTFIHAFASGGLHLYLLCIAIIYIMLCALDSRSSESDSSFSNYVSIFTAVLLAEQFLFTSLLTSGLIILYTLIFTKFNPKSF